jgi:hypothetical protein
VKIPYQFKIIATFALALSEPLSGDHLDAVRTWNSADGREIRATMLDMDSSKQTVEMRRVDGLVFSMEWNQLSRSNRALLANHASEQTKISAAAPDAPNTRTLPETLPDKFHLKDVPMVKQKGNFCVPASATMIAGFHNIKTDQDEVAQLSSEASSSNEGTYPSDMLLAMEKLGFNGHAQLWEDAAAFYKTALPAIRRALVETGPIYISFKPNVFGAMGHGCIIVGYNDRREEMTFHNPWGSVFEKKYSEVASQGHGVVFIDPPQPAPVASEVLIETVRQRIPRFDGGFLALSDRLRRTGQAFELLWCSRRDARDDKHFAVDTARHDGRKILELAFERNPAVLIPSSPKGVTNAYYFVTRPPEGGASFLVREITDSGWSEPELKTLGSLTREWPTSFKNQDSSDLIWELPLIELQD